MRKFVYFLAIILVSANVCQAQFKIKNPLDKKKGNSNSNSGSNNNGNQGSGTSAGNTSTETATGKNFSETEAANALKEALKIAAKVAASRGSKVDGFFLNAEIKIFFPPEAQQMEKRLRAIGMGKQVDEAILAMNRAAEEACIEAPPVLLNAITKMTVNEAIKIVTGPNNSGTNYMERSTRADLTTTFTPIVKRALIKVAITKYWNPLLTKYNKIPGVKKINPNLDDFVTQKTLDGLFKLMAQEEAKVRVDPAAQTSDLLKKVFGKR